MTVESTQKCENGKSTLIHKRMLNKHRLNRIIETMIQAFLVIYCMIRDGKANDCTIKTLNEKLCLQMYSASSYTCPNVSKKE